MHKVNNELTKHQCNVETFTQPTTAMQYRNHNATNESNLLQPLKKQTHHYPAANKSGSNHAMSIVI